MIPTFNEIAAKLFLIEIKNFITTLNSLLQENKRGACQVPELPEGKCKRIKIIISYE